MPGETAVWQRDRGGCASGLRQDTSATTIRVTRASVTVSDSLGLHTKRLRPESGGDGGCQPTGGSLCYSPAG